MSTQAYRFRYQEALDDAGFQNTTASPMLDRLIEKAQQASTALANSNAPNKAALTEILVQVDAVICAAIQKEVKSLASSKIDQSKLEELKRLALERKKELKKD